MWSEDFDRKLREAASSHDAGYDDKSWDRMESLLDNHLPLEKKRRRFILWLLIPLLLTGPGILLLRQANTVHTSGRPATAASQPTTAPDSSSALNHPQPIVDNPSSPYKPVEQVQPSYQKDPFKPFEETRSAQSAQPTTYVVMGGKGKKQPGRLGNRRMTSVDEPAPIASNHASKESTDIVPDPLMIKTDPANNLQQQVEIPVKDDAETGNADPESPDAKATSEARSSQQSSSQTKRGNQLGINLSFGPDISSINLGNPGRVTMQFGVALSYPLSKRLLVLAGFFANRKIYDADSADYNPGGNFWAYYPNMQKIEANCMVYEIPVTLLYHFAPKGKHNWFVSGGLSSYLMKEETYEYYFKDNYGQPRTRTWSLDNGSNHPFSVLSFSGGYQYHVNSRWSLMAEPYVKLPLGGVGFGNVKLSGSGILFSATYKPFTKSK